MELILHCSLGMILTQSCVPTVAYLSYIFLILEVIPWNYCMGSKLTGCQNTGDPTGQATIDV